MRWNMNKASLIRLKQYVKDDVVYQNYKKQNLTNANDFERFCIVHCRDIENLLKEYDRLKKMENKNEENSKEL